MKRAFTLIELLVVVAVLAILAAIALPNFLEAQLRSKVSRSMTDLRTLAVGLEAYAVDWNRYPSGNRWGVAGARGSIAGDPTVLERTSTPVAYLTNAFLRTPFPPVRRSNIVITGAPPLNTNFNEWLVLEPEGADSHLYRTYNYVTMATDRGNSSGLRRALCEAHPADPDRGPASIFLVQAAGPMNAYINMGGVIVQGTKRYSVDLFYDPTNGSVSFGNLFRAGGQGAGGDNFMGAVAATNR